MNFRTQLRDKTNLHHQNAEKATTRFASIETLNGYSVFLRGMHFLYTKYGRAIDQASLLFGVPPRSQKICKNLSLDIQSLSGNASSSPMGSEPLPTAEEALLAIGYVFEGSSLGSTILLKRARESSESQDMPHHYLSQMSGEARQRWPRVLKELSRRPMAGQKSILGACQVFNDFAQTMERIYGE